MLSGFQVKGPIYSPFRYLVNWPPEELILAAAGGFNSFEKAVAVFKVNTLPETNIAHENPHLSR